MYSPTMTAPQPASPLFDPGTPSTSHSAHPIRTSSHRLDGASSYFPSSIATPSAERGSFNFGVGHSVALGGTKRRTPPSSSSSAGTASQDAQMGYFGANIDSLKVHRSQTPGAQGSSTPLSPYKHFRPSPAAEQAALHPPPTPSQHSQAHSQANGRPIGLMALEQYQSNKDMPSVTSPSSFVIPSISSPSNTHSFGAASAEGMPRLSLPSMASRQTRKTSSASMTPESSSPSRSASKYSAITASTLASQVLSLAPTTTMPPLLLLDVRSRSNWSTCRIRGSLNISIPSTLMRRAAHTIDRVAESLDEEEQAQFEQWRTCDTIVVLDGDTGVLNDSNPVASLLAKFEKAGFGGRLAWLKGGFSAAFEHVRAHDEHSAMLEYGMNEDMSAPSDDSRPALSRGESSASASSTTSTSSRPVLSARDLPQSAFQQSSTSTYVHSSQASAMRTENSTTSSRRMSVQSQRSLSNRREGSAPMRLSLSNSSGSSGSSSNGSIGARRVATNPFFDNIRQNAEYLSLDRSMANLHPVELPQVDEAHRAQLPQDLVALIDMSPMDRARKLARQFYELEVTERDRLEGAFNWQATSKSDGKASHKYAKYGISAGFELGNLNRFKNIFPYEHTRVRLSKPSSHPTDYINASHINFKTSPKRFIASQGPLKATFDDFWQMIDQERCGVIVMLTNLQEGGREKCSRYWLPGRDSEWDIESTLDANGEVEHDDAESVAPRNPGDYFATARTSTPAALDESSKTTPLVRRTIRAKRRSPTSSSNAAPRKVRHLHYRAWPDFDLPASPDDIVSLVREVNEAQQEYMREIGWTDTEHEPPILAHCSAGVGRTGVFIMVSTMLDKLRRDRARARARSSSSMRAVSSSSSSVHSDTASLTAGFEAQTLRSQTASPALSIDVDVSSDEDDHDVEHEHEGDQEQAEHRHANGERSKSGSKKEKDKTAPLDKVEPIFAAANEMRESRMSMIANYRQYVCVHECVLLGTLQDIDAGL